MTKPVAVGPRWLTRFEKARIIGGRALQLSLGAPPLIQLDSKKAVDNLTIAEQELKQGLLPLTVVRRTPRGEEFRIPVKDLLEATYHP
ncbi:MAG: DNA-directed RNA polymerase subunit K [Candidatus Marsarchaeota archaeon]|nr:DNA-directed RNA polymerase subunit K [Candidatus Marsarchaeota archaeon]